MQSDPVIVPVEVDTTRAVTALQGLGNTIQTVQQAAARGAAPGVAGAATTPTGGGDLLLVNTLRGLSRDLASLETSVSRLVIGIDKLLAFQQQGVGVAVPAVREAPRPEPPEAREAGGGEGVARPARPEGGGEGAIAQSMREASSTFRQVLLGGLALGGVGVGIGGAYQQIQSWIREATAFGTGIGRIALTAGTPGDPFGRVYGRLEHDFLREPRGAMERMIAPSELVRGADTLGNVIGNIDLVRRMARPLAAVGMMAYGQPGPGFQIGAAAYETFRSEKIPELLGTLVRQADAAGIS